MGEPLKRAAHPAFDPQVQHAQRLLRAAGYKIDDDGKFGALTELATIAFQRKKHLKDTGTIDAGTLSSLQSTADAKSQKKTTQSAAPASTIGALPVPNTATLAAEPPIPQCSYTTVGDSIMVGVGSHLRGKAFKKLQYHLRKDEKSGHPEMVGKGTRYIQSRIKKDVIPLAKQLGLKTVVLDGGTNDFLAPMVSDQKAEEAFAEVTKNYAENVRMLRQAGLQVVALSLPPEGLFIERMSKFSTPEIKARAHKLWQRINDFILGLNDPKYGATVIIDVTKVLGDTKDGVSTWRLEYRQKGDLLHPNASGATALARAVEAQLRDLELFSTPE